jgi:SAM-dependent methyltransferase
MERMPGAKGRGELTYWLKKQAEEGVLRNDHYEFLYTEHWGLTRSAYEGKSIVDIGCGPRGSLEWATNAAKRVGLDSLVPQYKRLGIDKHGMTYVAHGIESTPFSDGEFDFVASVNSLDHVDDLDLAIKEIKRITKVGGLFLLLVEVNHEPTVCEPHSLTWSVVESFKPEFEEVNVRHYEMTGHDMRATITGPAFDHSAGDPNRPGMLSAMLRRTAPQ